MKSDKKKKSIIRRMARLLKTRWLLRELRKSAFNVHKMGNRDEQVYTDCWPIKDVFVSYYRDNAFFLWWKWTRKEEGRARETEILKSIIDECKNSSPQLIYQINKGELVPGTNKSTPDVLIKTTGEGDRLALSGNTIRDFIFDSAWLTTGFYGIIVYLTTQIPPIKAWICDLIVTYVPMLNWYCIVV